MSENEKEAARPFPWFSLVIGILVVFVLTGMLWPLNLKAAKAGDRTIALANAKSVVGGLLVFKNEHGAFPCDATREFLEEKGLTNIRTGTNANAYLSQLLAAGAIDSEQCFFTPGGVGMKKGDDEFDTAANVLERGENGFAYIMAESGMPLTDTKSFTPLILAPVRQRGPEPLFDRKPYGNKAVMGLADGSATTIAIDDEGKLISEGRESFFETGENSLFGTDLPVLTYPLGIPE